MAAVSFDEAWGQTIGPNFEPESVVEIEQDQLTQNQLRKTSRLSKHKSAKYAEHTEHKKRKQQQDDTENTMIHDLISKLQEVRQETTEERMIRQGIVYASIIMIIILICINLITLNRLHYTTETLLLYVKHRT